MSRRENSEINESDTIVKLIYTDDDYCTVRMGDSKGI